MRNVRIRKLSVSISIFEKYLFWKDVCPIIKTDLFLLTLELVFRLIHSFPRNVNDPISPLYRPPFGYSQTKIERPVLGILQPSVGIPFKPLEDFDGDEEKMDTEVVKKVLTDQVSTMKQEGRHTEEEITNHIGLNHSEFAAAARFVSTPFVENLNPPMLETLHCSSIEAYEGRQCDVSENSSNVSSSSYNANSSKVLSPILECSDEDAKTASSKGSSHSSGVFTKSNVQTTQSVSTCQADGVFEDSFTSCASKVRL